MSARKSDFAIVEGLMLKGTGFVGALVRVIEIKGDGALVALRGGRRKRISLKTLAEKYRPATKRQLELWP